MGPAKLGGKGVAGQVGMLPAFTMVMHVTDRARLASS